MELIELVEIKTMLIEIICKVRYKEHPEICKKLWMAMQEINKKIEEVKV